MQYSNCKRISLQLEARFGLYPPAGVTPRRGLPQLVVGK